MIRYTKLNLKKKAVSNLSNTGLKNTNGGITRDGHVTQ
jgi:hypothetical protein